MTTAVAEANNKARKAAAALSRPMGENDEDEVVDNVCPKGDNGLDRTSVASLMECLNHLNEFVGSSSFLSQYLKETSLDELEQHLVHDWP